MSAKKPPAKKPPKKSNGDAAKKGRPPANRHRVGHQITISPEATAMIDEAVARFGPGTKSILIDMAVRHAKRTGLYDGDMLGTVSSAPAKTPTLDGALWEHLPVLLKRLYDDSKQNGGG